jgi:hypothetical protein
VAGGGSNQEVRVAQQSLWLCNQEISYGFMAIVIQAFGMTNESLVGTTTASPVMWPGLEASTVQFEANVSAALGEGSNVGLLPFIKGPLPHKEWNG